LKLHKSAIPGCFEIEYTAHADTRGSFVKTFHATSFRALGLETDFAEAFYSTSSEGVIRGMHFQLPPADGAKLVYCLQGEVLDLALDLRKGSPSFGQSATFSLTPGRPVAVYIPRGVAHGFLALREPATLVYSISSEYNPEADTGVLWNSFGFDWPVTNPLLSPRDHNFCTLADFDSPFTFSLSEWEAHA
jgi:dTDP-4-dehydrorhamnose 3,5-epimerase